MANHLWVIERSRLFRQGLALLVTGTDMQVTRELQHVGSVALAPEDPPPALVIVSLETDLEPGGEERRELERVCGFGAPVVVLSDRLSLPQLVMAMKAGAQGYLMKDISPAALIQSLHLVLSGEKVMPTELVDLLLDGRNVRLEPAMASGAALSQRETHILRYLAEGYPNKRIARELNMAESMVKFEVKKIFRKIRATNRTEAALWARGRQFPECMP
ncbi:MAG: LuxR C-terminal-related transcriptional regulator [Sphingomonadales bacterium]